MSNNKTSIKRLILSSLICAALICALMATGCTDDKNDGAVAPTQAQTDNTTVATEPATEPATDNLPDENTPITEQNDNCADDIFVD